MNQYSVVTVTDSKVSSEKYSSECWAEVSMNINMKVKRVTEIRIYHERKLIKHYERVEGVWKKIL